jgi:hypothetical protein
MNNISLFKWGGYSAFAFVGLFIVSIGAYWITGGLEFQAWVPLFSTLVCFWFVAAIAACEYLKPSQNILARIGFGFAVLSIVILLLEAIVWGADQAVLRSAEPGSTPKLTELMALFNSLHSAVLWTIGIWYALWGTAFLRMPGFARLIGVAMIGVAAAHGVDYLLLRLGVTGQLVEVWHLVGGQGLNLVAYAILGAVLLKASQSESN